MRRTAGFIAILLIISFIPVCTAAASEDPVTLNEEEGVILKLSAPSSGNFLIELEYQPITGKTVNPQISLYLSGNGADYTRSVTLPRIWEDIREESRFTVDAEGNELVPRQTEIAKIQRVEISLTGGGQSVFLDAGSYDLSLTVTSCSIQLYRAELIPENTRSYKEYRSEFENLPTGSEKAIFLEAELPSFKSTAGIIPTFDNSSPDISPSDPGRTMLGFISTGFQEGQWIEWSFSADAPGWYRLVFSFRQNSMRGLGVRRRLTLDGESLFDEANELIFPFTEGFTTLSPSDGDTDYYFYLNAGEHTLRLTVTPGSLVEPLNELQAAVSCMNKIYRDILMITGASPDIYRDYYPEKEIPTLIDDLTYCRDALNSSARSIEKLSEGRSGSETAPLDEAIRIINDMLEKPFRIPSRLASYKSQVDAVANQSVYLREQPLELDTIEFLPANSNTARVKYSIIDRIWYRLKIFFKSFASNYSVADKSKEKLTPLKVWMSVSELQMSGSAAGREQLQILKRLWSEESSNPVSFSLVNTNDVITQAIISGKGPDVALFVPEQTVINLAVRGALADLSQMEDIEGIKARFHPSALVTSSWSNGLYSLPETQNWFMLFCRTDILESCELQIPETWDEMYQALRVLRQRNMMVGIPEDQRVYEMLLMQRGGKVYNDSLSATRLTEDISVAAFSDWTDFFVKHSTPISYDFYNRFRTGEMPLGISDYTLYNQLQVAAPELQGLWKMMPVPGIKSSDGTVNKSQPCTVNACIVVESSGLKKQAYEFIKWWTEENVQERFGAESEILLGTAGRYNTANVNAAKGLSWTDKELASLEAAREELWDTRLTPASYYYNRNILNAFRRVVYNYESPRDVLGRYAREVDRELERKNTQLRGSENR